jgi:hypothetical protein
MSTFQVKLWPEGKWDGEPYRKVEAATPKEAAEKSYGRPLQDLGSNSQIRAQVRSLDAFRQLPTIFYEN